MTTATPRQQPPSSPAEPEQQRSKKLLFLLIAPPTILPVAFWLAAVTQGKDPFGDETLNSVKSGLLPGLNATIVMGLVVMLVPWFSDWFGLPSLSRGKRDEREEAIFNKATRVTFIVTLLGLLVVGVSTANLAVVALLGVITATFYVSYIVLSRRI